MTRLTLMTAALVVIGGSANLLACPVCFGEIAALDVYQWQQEVHAALPAAVASVQVAPVSGLPANTFVISIRWVQPGDAEAVAFVLRVQA